MLHLLSATVGLGTTIVAGGAALSYNQLAAALGKHQDLRLARLACGKLEHHLPAGMCESGWGVA
jgi:hypothetical protein